MVSPPAPGQRKRVDHRPGARLQVEVVKAPQHGLAVRHRRRRIPPAAGRLARHRVRRSRRLPFPATAGRTAARIPPVRPGRLIGQLNPAQEIPGFRPGRLIPRHLHSPQEPEPAQQVHPIRSLRRRRPPGCCHLPQIRRRRADRPARGIGQPERLEQVPSRLKRPAQRHRQPGQVPRRISSGDHGARR